MTRAGWYLLKSELLKFLREDQLLEEKGALAAYECDAYTVDKHPPVVVLLPESTEQVALIVKIAARLEIPVTPRGAGTGLSGGAMPALGGIVLSTKRLNKILHVDAENRSLHAQAGVVNAHLSSAVQTMGLHFAPDPSSQTVCTLGGNIAENSGGPHTLKYGVTAPHVLSVTMVDRTGEILTLGGDTADRPGLDLLSLVIGSEGLLGIVTEAVVRLTPLPDKVSTALIAFGSVRQATEAVSAIVAAGIIPAALEMMDKGVLHALKVAFGLEYPEGTEALLLVETDAVGPKAGEQCEAEMKLIEAIAKAKSCLSFVQAQDSNERAKLWTARKKGVGAMGRLAPSIVTHDGVIPRSKLPEMLDTVYRVAAQYGLGVANIFHAGDGNLHPCFYFDDRDPHQVEAVVKAGEEIMRHCIELGGALTGEHGIGLEKAELMKLMFTEEDLAFQTLPTQVFGAMNPCKVLPDQKGCTEHKRNWRKQKAVAW